MRALESCSLRSVLRSAATTCKPKSLVDEELTDVPLHPTVKLTALISCHRHILSLSALSIR
jgi:hypothetical protein